MDAITPQTVGSLLLADAEPASRAALQAALAQAGWEVLVADNGQMVAEILGSRAVDLAVLDLRWPDISGISLIEQARTLRPGLPVIATAAALPVELAVAAMQAGAVDCLAKPFDYGVLQPKLAEWTLLRDPCQGQVVRLGGCLSIEPIVRAVLTEAARLAPSDLPVAICGAPGTGRKTLAGAMHQVSQRGGPLQIIDISLLPAEQVRARLGQAVEAAGPKGAVLVADIQQIKPAEQEPLARLLVASGSSMPRLFVTLSDAPSRLLAAGRLSKSLSGRLGSTVLSLPPLMVRRADMRLLAEQIVAQVMPGATPALSPAALQALVQYEWPGNVRQLRLVLERAARLAGSGSIEPRHLPILQAVHRDPVPMGWTAAGPVNLQEIVDTIERQLIDGALCRTNQNQAKAAELLGIPRTTLRDKLDKYGFTARSRANEAGRDG